MHAHWSLSSSFFRPYDLTLFTLFTLPATLIIMASPQILFNLKSYPDSGLQCDSSILAMAIRFLPHLPSSSPWFLPGNAEFAVPRISHPVIVVLSSKRQQIIYLNDLGNAAMRCDALKLFLAPRGLDMWGLLRIVGNKSVRLAWTTRSVSDFMWAQFFRRHLFK